ncbi:MAG: ATP synthase subunit I [Bradymonadaceae bacterium]
MFVPADGSAGEIAADVVRLTAALGAVVAGLAGLVAGWHVGASVLLGAATSVGNLLVLAKVTDRMQQSAVDGNSSMLFWGAILALKMLALMLVTVLAVLVVGASPFGFVIGYSLFLPAIGVRVTAGRGRAPEDDETTPDSDAR